MRFQGARVYPTRVEIAAPPDSLMDANDPSRVLHPPLVNRARVAYRCQHYVLLFQRKHGALRNGPPLADMPEGFKHLRRSARQKRIKSSTIGSLVHSCNTELQAKFPRQISIGNGGQY